MLLDLTRLAQADHVRQALPAQPVRVPVDHALLEPQAHAQASAQVPVLAAVHQASAHQDQAAVAQVVAVAVQAPPAPSVRVVAAIPAKPVNQNARNAKSLNREAHQASVAQLCHAVTAVRSFVFVAAPASKILQTRLTPMPVS